MTIRQLLLCSGLLIISFFGGCKDNITNPNLIGGNSICYEKSYSGHWEIFANNIIGTNPINISNYQDDDEYPQWSPDGRYIVFSRSVTINGPLIIVYDTKNKTEINLTSDGGGASLNPQWMPNGKLCFGYPYIWAPYKGTYIMNPDGTDKKKILDSTASAIYFYIDNYTFLYVLETELYRTNIDGTFNEFIFDLQPTLSQFYTIRDFNPYTGDLLINTNTIPGSSSTIVTYNAENRQINTIISADSGYTLVKQRYSKDYTKIAFIEIDTISYNEEYLSVFENGIKKRLVKLTGDEWFDYNPMQFSYDGQYVAFSKNVYQSGQWISWKSYLYVVNIYDGTLFYIDEGINPSWNLQP